MFRIVDETDYSLLKMFEQRVAEHPDRPLFREMDKDISLWTYQNVFALTKKIAAAFLRAAEKPRVLIYLENCPEGACADLACLTHGILVSPVDRHFDQETLAYIVDSTAAPVVSIALITTWIGYEVSLIDEALQIQDDLHRPAVLEDQEVLARQAVHRLALFVGDPDVDVHHLDPHLFEQVRGIGEESHDAVAAVLRLGDAQHGADADQDRIVLLAQLEGALACGIAGDPLRGAVGGGGGFQGLIEPVRAHTYGLASPRRAPHADWVVLPNYYLPAEHGGQLHVRPGGRGGERSEERRVGKECRSRWSPYH